MRGEEADCRAWSETTFSSLTCQLSMNLLQLLSAVLFCLLLELPEGPSKALQLQLLGPQLSLPSPLLSLRKQAPGPAPDFTPSFPSHLIPRSPSPPGLGELLWCPGPLEAGPAAPTVPLPPPREQEPDGATEPNVNSGKSILEFHFTDSGQNKNGCIHGNQLHAWLPDPGSLLFVFLRFHRETKNGGGRVISTTINLTDFVHS